MTHKIVFTNPVPTTIPVVAVLTVQGTLGSINAYDSMLNIGQGTDYNERLGNRIHVLYSKFHFTFSGNLTSLCPQLWVPVGYSGIWMFEIYAVKGKYEQLLNNVDAYFLTGGAYNLSAFTTAALNPHAIDPTQVGFFIKRKWCIKLAELYNTGGANGDLIIPRPIWKTIKVNGALGQMDYAGHAAILPYTTRKIFVFINTYDVPIGITVGNKTVFVDATK